jgi:hypothetical protein
VKKRSVVFIGVLVALVGFSWAVRWFVTQRTEIISMPMESVRVGVDQVLSERERVALEQAAADQAVIDQSELLIAHQALRVALESWGELNDVLVCQRAQALHRKLTDWRSQTGKSLEEIYKLELAAHMQRVHRWHAHNSGVHGDAKAIAEARAIQGDTAALFYLGDLIYSGQGVPLCQDNFSLEIAQLSQVFNEVAARVQRREQNLKALEAEHLRRAQEVWNRQAESGVQPAIVRRPLEQPDAPAEPVEADVNFLRGFLYGE